MKDGNTLTVSSLFMGTIHTVLFVDDVEADWIETLGEEICNAPTFAEKTNVNFVKVLDDHTLQMITYERGVGMTQACGTGACASVVTAARKGQNRRGDPAAGKPENRNQRRRSRYDGRSVGSCIRR